MTGLAGTGATGKAGAEKLDFVDRMRGIAILGVMLVHFSQDFSSQSILSVFAVGQYGVQVFFFASAFTLCLSHDQRYDERKAKGNFAIRRFFRIAPMYYLGILLYGLREWMHGHAGAYTLGNVVTNVLFIHAFVPEATNTVVPGGWSIAVEMVFYAMFPWLYPAVDKAWKKWGMPALVALFALAVSLMLAFQMLVVATASAELLDEGLGIYAFPYHFPPFVLGIAYYLSAHRDGSFAARPLLDWVCLGLTIMLCAGGLLAGSTVPLGYLPSVAGLGAIGIANILRRQVRPGGMLVRIGKVSFSLYVLHFAVMWYAMAHVVPRLKSDPVLEWLAFGPLFLASLVVLMEMAGIAKWLVEDRFNNLARKQIARREMAAKVRSD